MAADDADTPAPALQSFQEPPTAPPSRGIDITHGNSGRGELLVQARSFLTSPQVVHEDTHVKRRFLLEKGLTELEISNLIEDLPSPLPIAPARTYPQPPPSNLPNLLVGIARITTWLAGGTAAFLAIYFRFILPRLTRSFQARHALRVHQRVLFDRLQLSLSEYRNTQVDNLKALPRGDQFKEEAPFAACTTLDELLASRDNESELETIPNVSLLRCAIQDCTKELEHSPNAEELFNALQTKLPFLAKDSAGPILNTLWEILNTAPTFHKLPPPVDSPDSPSTWSYSPAPAPSPPALLTSLSSLKSSLPLGSSSEERQSTHRHTLQSLADFTGYLTTHAYSFSLGSGVTRPLYGGDTKLEPAADEVRREIRALKGLVLNRRSFMPPSAAPSAVPAHPLISS